MVVPGLPPTGAAAVGSLKPSPAPSLLTIVMVAALKGPAASARAAASAAAGTNRIVRMVTSLQRRGRRPRRSDGSAEPGEQRERVFDAVRAHRAVAGDARDRERLIAALEVDDLAAAGQRLRDQPGVRALQSDGEKRIGDRDRHEPPA